MRIGINVPNELVARVKAVRPEVNVSQVCRNALEDIASRAERAAEQAAKEDRLTKAIRAFAESENASLVEPDWEAMAYEDARKWIEGLDTEGWWDFIEDRDLWAGDGRLDGFWSVQVDAMVGCHQRRRDHQDYLFRQFRVDCDAYNEMQHQYLSAWRGYVDEVSREVDQRLKDEQARVEAERTAAGHSRPAPSLPPWMRNE